MNGWKQENDWSTIAKGDIIRVTDGDIALEGHAYGEQQPPHHLRLELWAMTPRLSWLESHGFILHTRKKDLGSEPTA